MRPCKPLTKKTCFALDGMMMVYQKQNRVHQLCKVFLFSLQVTHQVQYTCNEQNRMDSFISVPPHVLVEQCEFPTFPKDSESRYQYRKPYQDVEPPKLISDEIREPRSAGGVCDVQLVEDDIGVDVGAPDGLDRFQAPGLVPRREDDPESPGSQLPARLQPDPFVAPRDQSDPSCDSAVGCTKISCAVTGMLAGCRETGYSRRKLTSFPQDSRWPFPWLLLSCSRRGRREREECERRCGLGEDDSWHGHTFPLSE